MKRITTMGAVTACCLSFLLLKPARSSGAAANDSLVGTWSYGEKGPGDFASLELRADGRYTWYQQAAGGPGRSVRGTWAAREGRLLCTPEGAAQPGVLPYRVRYREAFLTDIGYVRGAGLTMFSPSFAVSSRAPAEQFDDWKTYILSSLYSFKVNPLWAAMYRLTLAKTDAKIDEVRNYCAKIDAQIVANRSKTNSSINSGFYRDVIAPYREFKGPDGATHFLPNHEKHQVDREGNIYSGENFKKDALDRTELK